MNKAFIYIIIGAGLWGTIGWFVKHLYSFSFTPMEVVTLRVVSAALILLIYLVVKAPKQLKLQNWTDITYFVGTGILSITFFNYCMFMTIELSTIPVATALLYTAPGFVIILSFLLFKEPLTKLKIITLLITIVGVAFVAGVIPLNLKLFQFKTILFGLGSGLGYAFYSIFSKYALRKYSSLTITTYTFVLASIALIPFFPYKEKSVLFTEPNVLLLVFGLGFLPTAFAYIIYTYGLNKTEASKASILSTIEPVVATIIGVFVFTEPFSLMQLIGMSLIILAVIIIQLEARTISPKPK